MNRNAVFIKLRRSRGFTLTEMIIAMVLAMIIMSTIIMIFSFGRRAYDYASYSYSINQDTYAAINWIGKEMSQTNLSSIMVYPNKINAAEKQRFFPSSVPATPTRAAFSSAITALPSGTGLFITPWSRTARGRQKRGCPGPEPFTDGSSPLVSPGHFPCPLQFCPRTIYRRIRWQTAGQYFETSCCRDRT